MDKKTAIAELKKARDRLAQVGEADERAGRRYETDAYHEANEAVIEAEENAKRAGVPFWRR